MAKKRLFTLPRLRLSHQLIGFFVLVVLFPLLLLTISIYSINKNALKKQVAHFTESTAENTAENLHRELTWEEAHTQLATQFWIHMLEDNQGHLQNEEAAGFFKQFPQYQSVAVYNKSGQLSQWVSPENRFEPLLHFNPKLKSRKPQLTLLYLPADPMTPPAYYLKIVVPADHLTQANIGTLLFYKRFPYMDQLIADKSKSFHSGFLVVDPVGTIIAGPRKLISRPIPPTDLKIYRKTFSGELKEVETPELAYQIAHPGQDDPKQNHTIPKLFIRIADFQWGLIIENPRQSSRDYILRAQSQTFALIGLCILVIIILGFLYSNGINRNFRQLIKGIKALAEGRYSRKIRLITKSWTPHEIVLLTGEFNRMAVEISKAWDNIQALNQELVYKNAQDEFIAKATREIHSTMELEWVCQRAAEMLTQHPKIQQAWLYLKKPNEGYILQTSTTHIDRHLLSEPEQTELEALALMPEQALWLNHSQLSWLPETSQIRVQPIVYQHQHLGTLILMKKMSSGNESPLANEDMMVIDLIADQIGVAIYQARQWEQLEAAHKELSRLDEMKSNLIDTVSHELRTPLTSIKGYTSRLIRYDDTLDTDTRIKSLKVVKQQADRLQRLVEDLLVIPDLERQEGLRVYPDRVDLDELLSRSVAFIQGKANRAIHVFWHQENTVVLVDPDRLEQVFINLLDNAVKYSDEEATIEISVNRGNTAQIEFYNPCEPIPEEELPKLFAKFKRLDERLTRTTRGTGLGLFITKGLIEAMGGQITLSGDQGFRVTVQLPLYEEKASDPDATESASLLSFGQTEP